MQVEAITNAMSVAQQAAADTCTEHHMILQECQQMRLYFAWLLQLAAVLQDDEGRSPALSSTSRKVISETDMAQEPPAKRAPNVSY